MWQFDSELRSQPFEPGGDFANGSLEDSAAAQPRSAIRTADKAIDAALRSVPLPEGLLTRLGRLVYTISEDTPDQVDWLGC